MSNVKLITLMVLVITLVAGSALAGGDYKVYGKLHLSTDMMNDTEDTQIRLSNNTSRFGIKGASEMNEDFTLFWKFENSLNLAQKSGGKEVVGADGELYLLGETLATRNSYIGFKHEYGSILFGIHDTPFKTLGRKSTFFFDSLGDHRTVMMKMDKRLAEVVMFTTKNYEGFQASAMYQMDQNELGDPDAANIMSFNAMYKKDAYFLGAAMEMKTKGNYYAWGDYDLDEATDETWESGKWVDADDDPLTVDVWEAADPESEMAMRFAGGYNADEFALRAFFQNLSNKGGEKDLSATTFGGEAKYTVNADYSVKGAFYMADPNTDKNDDEYNMLAFGVDRHFGKSQWIYLQYAMVMNADASNATLGGAWHGNSVTAPELYNEDGALVGGESPYGISFGMVKVW